MMKLRDPQFVFTPRWFRFSNLWNRTDCFYSGNLFSVPMEATAYGNLLSLYLLLEATVDVGPHDLLVEATADAGLFSSVSNVKAKAISLMKPSEIAYVFSGIAFGL